MKLFDKASLKFAKVKKDAKIPSKREEDAGYDLYACFDEPYIVIKPGQTKLIGAGVASAFPAGYAAIIKERGSTGTKCMAVRAGVVDSGYRGEWIVPINNTGEKSIVICKDNSKDITAYDSIYVGDAIIYPYSKAIAQAVFVQIPSFHTEEVEYSELVNISSERGNGKLGSSGK